VPYANEIKAAYNVETWHVSYTMFIYTVMYVVFNIPAVYLFNRFGLQIPTIIASICYITGAWVRLFANSFEHGFIMVMIGQTIAGFGWTFMVQAPTKVAALWFGDNERSLATTIASLSGPIGCIIGFVLPMAFIKVNSPS